MRVAAVEGHGIELGGRAGRRPSKTTPVRRKTPTTEEPSDVLVESSGDLGTAAARRGSGAAPNGPRTSALSFEPLSRGLRRHPTRRRDARVEPGDVIPGGCGARTADPAADGWRPPARPREAGPPLDRSQASRRDGRRSPRGRDLPEDPSDVLVDWSGRPRQRTCSPWLWRGTNGRRTFALSSSRLIGRMPSTAAAQDHSTTDGRGDVHAQTCHADILAFG